MRYLPAALPILASLATLTPSGSAQVSFFGQACEGESGEKPTLAIVGIPVDSEPLEIVVGGPALTLGLVIGGDAKSFPPLMLDAAGIPGCELFVEPLVFVPFTTGVDGKHSMPFDTWTAGLTLFVQAFVLDSGPTTTGALTRAAEITALDAGGAIVITEIMKDPDFVGDSSGEWIELYNRTSTPVDIEGWTLRDEGSDLHVLDAGGAGILVPAGGYVTLGNEADPLLNGNLTHAAVLSNFLLGNGSDQVILEDALGALVDRVDFEDGASWPNEIGSALSRDPVYAHTYYSNAAERWSPASCDLGGVPFNPDKGTPGTDNDECNVSPPAAPSGELIFSEVMQNPKEVFDEVGEWFELHNTTNQSINMNGWTLVIGAIESVSGNVVIPPGGYGLFALNGDGAVNGGLPTPDYVLADGLFLGNGSELLQVYDSSFGLVCELAYDNGATFPDPVGSSMTLDRDKLDIASSLVGANWCEASSVYGAGDDGTPGAANDDCP